MSYLEKLDKNRIPTHVAIIMDGNGRWAKQCNQSRNFGHQAGVETVRQIVKTAVEVGVKYLTLYTFSTENWNRPADEVVALMTLLFNSIEEEIFLKNEVGLRIIGDMERLPENVRRRLEECMERINTKETRMTLVLALSYSSKWEITRAVRQIAGEVKNGVLAIDDICEDTVARRLSTSFMPDPDLLIRTGGELRLSNYLLWQCAYAELYFCDKFWPDFNEEEFYKALYAYQQRERRFGKTSEQVMDNE